MSFVTLVSGRLVKNPGIQTYHSGLSYHNLVSVICSVLTLEALEMWSKIADDFCSFHRDCMKEKHSSYNGPAFSYSFFECASLTVMYNF